MRHYQSTEKPRPHAAYQPVYQRPAEHRTGRWCFPCQPPNVGSTRRNAAERRRGTRHSAGAMAPPNSPLADTTSRQIEDQSQRRWRPPEPVIINVRRWCPTSFVAVDELGKFGLDQWHRRASTGRASAIRGTDATVDRRYRCMLESRRSARRSSRVPVRRWTSDGACIRQSCFIPDVAGAHNGVGVLDQSSAAAIPHRAGSSARVFHKCLIHAEPASTSIRGWYVNAYAPNHTRSDANHTRSCGDQSSTVVDIAFDATVRLPGGVHRASSMVTEPA